MHDDIIQSRPVHGVSKPDLAISGGSGPGTATGLRPPPGPTSQLRPHSVASLHDHSAVDGILQPSPRLGGLLIVIGPATVGQYATPPSARVPCRLCAPSQ